MKKPFKVISTATMASVLASTALIPVAAQAAENEASQLELIVFEKENKELVSLTVKEYGVAIFKKQLKEKAIKEFSVIQADNGEFYSLKEYGLAIFKNKGDVKKAFKSINPLNLKDVKEGKIENGFVVAKDEQPEDRLNETFFYNVA